MNIVYRTHAIERMFQRDIEENEVEQVVENGEVIETYPDDYPYPSCLVLGYIGTRPLHVVYATDDEGSIIVITVYEPTLEKWMDDLKTRRER